MPPLQSSEFEMDTRTSCRLKDEPDKNFMQLPTKKFGNGWRTRPTLEIILARSTKSK